jgi:hypothetical protein
MPGVLDTFSAFRRRLAAPRVLSPVLPARHPRRCRKCGGLLIPDRSRRYSFARPELVDAMGFQIKPGVGVSFKKGAGVIVADSSKPCCCAGCSCACSLCSGFTNPCCITIVISGFSGCECNPDPSTGWNGVTITGVNGTYLGTCPGTQLTGWSSSAYPFDTYLGTSSACGWSYSTTTTPLTRTFRVPNAGNTACEDCPAGAFGGTQCTVTDNFVINVRNTGSGAMQATIWPQHHSTWLGSFSTGIIFSGTATTTTGNACSLATAVTFTNTADCSGSPGNIAFGGTLTAQATTCP